MESGELKTLLTQMSVDVWRGATQFLALTGLQIGELIALKKNDIDLDGRLIHVTKTFDTNNEVTTSTKTLTSTRDVFIQDELLPVVKELKVIMLQQKVLYSYDTPELFLTDINGSHLKYMLTGNISAKSLLKFLVGLLYRIPYGTRMHLCFWRMVWTLMLFPEDSDMKTAK